MNTKSNKNKQKWLKKNFETPLKIHVNEVEIYFNK